MNPWLQSSSRWRILRHNIRLTSSKSERPWLFLEHSSGKLSATHCTDFSKQHWTGDSAKGWTTCEMTPVHSEKPDRVANGLQRGTLVLAHLESDRDGLPLVSQTVFSAPKYD